MKMFKQGIMIFLIINMLTGCESESVGNRINTDNAVDKVVQQQINKTSQENNESQNASDEYLGEQKIDVLSEDLFGGKGTKRDDIGLHNGDVDYDLSDMGSDMVYATVWQMMTYPDQYIGKTFKVKGSYYKLWYEPTQENYHYVLIQDAMACCAQGVEFVWDKDTITELKEYPPDETEIEVTGTFETFYEEGDNNLYWRLGSTSINVVEN